MATNGSLLAEKLSTEEEVVLTPSTWWGLLCQSSVQSSACTPALCHLAFQASYCAVSLPVTIPRSHKYEEVEFAPRIHWPAPPIPWLHSAAQWSAPQAALLNAVPLRQRERGWLVYGRNWSTQECQDLRGTRMPSATLQRTPWHWRPGF